MPIGFDLWFLVSIKVSLGAPLHHLQKCIQYYVFGQFRSETPKTLVRQHDSRMRFAIPPKDPFKSAYSTTFLAVFAPGAPVGSSWWHLGSTWGPPGAPLEPIPNIPGHIPNIPRPIPNIPRPIPAQTSSESTFLFLERTHSARLRGFCYIGIYVCKPIFPIEHKNRATISFNFILRPQRNNIFVIPILFRITYMLFHLCPIPIAHSGITYLLFLYFSELHSNRTSHFPNRA